MTKVIIIQGGNLDSYYERTMEMLRLKYHTYPEPAYRKELPTLTESMRIDMGYYEEMARQAAIEANIDPNTPIGKLVV